MLMGGQVVLMYLVAFCIAFDGMNVVDLACASNLCNLHRIVFISAAFVVIISVFMLTVDVFNVWDGSDCGTIVLSMYDTVHNLCSENAQSIHVANKENERKQKKNKNPNGTINLEKVSPQVVECGWVLTNQQFTIERIYGVWALSGWVLSLWLIGTVRAEPETVISRAWVQSPDPAE